MTVEALLDECGGFGKYQVLVVFGVFVHKVLAGWSMMQMSYAGYAPDWLCGVSNTSVYSNRSMSLNKCSLNDTSTGYRDESCRSYLFEGSSRTVITEWDLVCDQKWVKATITSIQMAGVLLGAVLSGQLADLCGRKKTLFGFVIFHLLLNFAVIFSPTWEVFAAFRFFIGSGIGAILVVTLPYGMEFMPTKWRPLMSVIPHWPIGVSLFALGAFVLDNWVHMHIAVAVLSLPTLLGVFFVPESVRWLTLKGRYGEAEKIIEKMAVVNGKTPPKQTRAVLEKLYMEEREQKSSGREYTYWDLFIGWRNTKIALISCYVWFMLSMVFYGISFGVSALSGNLYLNIFLVGIIEVPLILSTFYFNNRVGRKKTFICLLVAGAICSCACLVVKIVVSEESEGEWITGFSMASKMVLAAAWTVSQTWVSELYPTVVRSLGYGLVNMAARVGGIVAPFSVDLDNRPMTAYAIITAMVVLAIFVSLFLPDTRGLVLSDSLTTTAKSTDPYKSTGLSAIGNGGRRKEEEEEEEEKKKDAASEGKTKEKPEKSLNGIDSGKVVNGSTGILVHKF